ITLKKLEEDSVDSGHYYVQILDYLREIAHCLTYIAEPSYEYIDNNHPPLHQEQADDLKALNQLIGNLFHKSVTMIQRGDCEAISALIKDQQEALELIHRMKKKQIKLIKAEMVGTRNSMVYFNLLSESKNLLLFTINMLKSHRDFLLFNRLSPSE
ncbi:MAG: hypothetical protein R6U86_00100, partial [Bacteroidales bacterium]